MIVTFTPNPAIDLTYGIDRLRPGEPHVVTRVQHRAGGKGVNTAAVLATLGAQCVALCPTGREDLRMFAADLDERGIRHELVPVVGRVRRTVAAVEIDGAATVFNEPGTSWSDPATRERIARTADDGVVLAVCGSIPPGSETAVLTVIEGALARGVRVVLDLRGDVLRQALALRPHLVKPNRVEAADTLGLDAGAPPPAAELAALLVSAGARAAAVSDGAQGVSLMVDDETRLHARLPEPLQGNATGAGDALTAALAMHLAQEACQWSAALRHGVACSAAAVLQPVAGEVDPHDVERLSPRVLIEEEPG